MYSSENPASTICGVIALRTFLAMYTAKYETEHSVPSITAFLASLLSFTFSNYLRFNFLRSIIAYLPRFGNEYFKKDLDNLKNAKLSARQVHIKKPSEELKEYVREEGTK